MRGLKGKMGRTFLGAVAVAATVLCLGGCGDRTQVEEHSGSTSQEITTKNEEDKSSTWKDVEKGLEVIKILKEKADSKAYATMVMASAELYDSDRLSMVRAQDVTNVKKIYRMTQSEQFMNALMTLDRKDVGGLDQFSEGLKKSLQDQILLSFLNIIGKKDVESLAISSTLRTGTLFVDENMANVRETLIYVFEDGYPVAVSFLGSEDGAVSASGSFLFLDDFKGDTETDVRDSILASFGGEEKLLLSINLSIEEVK